jgi:hypothetical protein
MGASFSGGQLDLRLVALFLLILGSGAKLTGFGYEHSGILSQFKAMISNAGGLILLSCKRRLLL